MMSRIIADHGVLGVFNILVRAIFGQILNLPFGRNLQTTEGLVGFGHVRPELHTAGIDQGSLVPSVLSVHARRSFTPGPPYIGVDILVVTSWEVVVDELAVVELARSRGPACFGADCRIRGFTFDPALKRSRIGFRVRTRLGIWGHGIGRIGNNMHGDLRLRTGGLSRTPHFIIANRRQIDGLDGFVTPNHLAVVEHAVGETHRYHGR